jgi:hypothetical protein
MPNSNISNITPNDLHRDSYSSDKYQSLSAFFSTCESKRQAEQTIKTKYVPIPSNIHDYIDYVVRDNEDNLKDLYFNI